MREQLIRYVDLLFAGAQDAQEMKQEILQNTLDRYDDLIDQGKAPEAAYRLAISGIGDINEILGGVPSENTSAQSFYAAPNEDHSETKKMRAIAVFMYILCLVPLIILSEFGLDTLGFCLTLMIVAAATALIIMSGKGTAREQQDHQEEISNPKQALRKSIRSIIFTLGLCIYFMISFMTRAWYITWLVFPIISAAQGLAMACMDFMEADQYEN